MHVHTHIHVCRHTCTHARTQGLLNKRSTWVECGAILPELVEYWLLLGVKHSVSFLPCQNPFLLVLGSGSFSHSYLHHSCMETNQQACPCILNSTPSHRLRPAWSSSVSCCPALPAPAIHDSPISNQVNPSYPLLFVSCLFPASHSFLTSLPILLSLLPYFLCCDLLECAFSSSFSLNCLGKRYHPRKCPKPNSVFSTQLLLLFLWLTERNTFIQRICP